MRVSNFLGGYVVVQNTNMTEALIKFSYPSYSPNFFTELATLISIFVASIRQTCRRRTAEMRERERERSEGKAVLRRYATSAICDLVYNIQIPCLC